MSEFQDVATIMLTVNGRDHSATVPLQATLQEVLHQVLKFRGSCPIPELGFAGIVGSDMSQTWMCRG